MLSSSFPVWATALQEAWGWGSSHLGTVRPRGKVARPWLRSAQWMPGLVLLACLSGNASSARRQSPAGCEADRDRCGLGRESSSRLGQMLWDLQGPRRPEGFPATCLLERTGRLLLLHSAQLAATPGHFRAEHRPCIPRRHHLPRGGAARVGGSDTMPPGGRERWVRETGAKGSAGTCLGSRKRRVSGHQPGCRGRRKTVPPSPIVPGERKSLWPESWLPARF